MVAILSKTIIRVYKRCSSLSWYSAFLSRLLHSLVVHWSSGFGSASWRRAILVAGVEAGSWVAASGQPQASQKQSRVPRQKCGYAWAGQEGSMRRCVDLQGSKIE